MAFYQHIDGVADCFAHRANALHGEIEFRRRECAPVIAEGIKLECCIALLDDLGSFFMKTLRRARTAVPAVRVGAQLAVASTAPEVVQRLIADLADNVPACDFNGSHGGHVDLCSFGCQISNELLRNDFDLKGIHPEDEILKLVNSCFDSLGEIIQGSFTNASHAFVSKNLCKKPVLPRISDQVSLYFDDFHSHGPFRDDSETYLSCSAKAGQVDPVFIARALPYQ